MGCKRFEVALMKLPPLKPLKWEINKYGENFAQTTFGRYFVWEEVDGWYYQPSFGIGKERWQKCSSFSDGKERCWKDFKERIRECFEEKL